MSNSFWSALENGANKLIDTINKGLEREMRVNELQKCDSLIDNMGQMLMDIKRNPKHLSKTNALWDMRTTITGKTTPEYDNKCQKLIEFIDTFNGKSIPTQDVYKPDFIEVINRSSMNQSGDYTTCNIEFMFNILSADYVIPYRPDLYKMEKKE